MKQYQTLTSEKYYIDKLETEAKIIRKLRTGRMISNFFASVILLSTFAICAYLLCVTPIVPDFIESLRVNGVLSR